MPPVVEEIEKLSEKRSFISNVMQFARDYILPSSFHDD